MKANQVLKYIKTTLHFCNCLGKVHQLMCFLQLVYVTVVLFIFFRAEVAHKTFLNDTMKLIWQFLWHKLLKHRTLTKITM